jgi:hypothetical protein
VIHPGWSEVFGVERLQEHLAVEKPDQQGPGDVPGGSRQGFHSDAPSPSDLKSRDFAVSGQAPDSLDVDTQKPGRLMDIQNNFCRGVSILIFSHEFR